MSAKEKNKALMVPGETAVGTIEVAQPAPPRLIIGGALYGTVKHAMQHAMQSRESAPLRTIDLLSLN